MARYGLAAMYTALTGGRAAVSVFTATSSPRPTPPPAVPLFAGGPTETEAPSSSGGITNLRKKYKQIQIEKSQHKTAHLHQS